MYLTHRPEFYLGNAEDDSHVMHVMHGACVGGCVCERKRKREREIEKDRHKERGRERKREREKKTDIKREGGKDRVH